MKKSEFQKLISEKFVVLDGSTGTELARMGLPAGTCPEQWVLDNPQVILDLQGGYRDAGSDIIFTPTFGGNRFKLKQFGLEGRVHEINKECAELSRKAVGDRLIFGDIAPSGRFIEPFGDVPFEEAVDAFKEQAAALIDGGVDGFIIETMLDIQEARAALLAVKETCDLPVIVSMTFEKDGRTLNGTDPVSALITLQSLGADAVGCNCSTGPADLVKLIELMKPHASVPLMAKPNAGMPKLVDGRTVFDMGPEDFASFVDTYIEAGANIYGGCCGTTAEHIKAIAEEAAGKTGIQPLVTSVSALSSARSSSFMGPGSPFVVIGERINPTGKKALQAELREGKTSIVQQFAVEQKLKGAGVLDVNMGLSGIDEKEMMLKVISLLSKSSELPLCIDTTRPDVVETALRLYPGRALVNSISGEKERIEETLPIVARYGAMFILLPLDDSGIPETLEDRKKVTTRVLKEAEKQGFTREDIVVDGLVMAISSDPAASSVTLGLIEWCSREMGLNTTCGVSNVSFGMPERKWINSTFLAMAVSRGLTSAIANPSSELMMNTITASDALAGRDTNLLQYIRVFAQDESQQEKKAPGAEISPSDMIYNCVLGGDSERIISFIEQALNSGLSAGDIVDKHLIPAIQKAGDKFDKKEYFLPQLIMSADAMKKGFSILEPLLLKDDNEEKPGNAVILATVKGDIHDIGKNIVALMLKNYGFRVIDMGKDVPAEDIISRAEKENVSLIGLSALMTTTMTEMPEVINLAREKKLTHIKFMIGGAVVDQNYADEIGAHGYAANAMEAVRLAQKLAEE